MTVRGRARASSTQWARASVATAQARVRVRVRVRARVDPINPTLTRIYANPSPDHKQVQAELEESLRYLLTKRDTDPYQEVVPRRAVEASNPDPKANPYRIPARKAFNP